MNALQHHLPVAQHQGRCVARRGGEAEKRRIIVRSGFLKSSRIVSWIEIGASVRGGVMSQRGGGFVEWEATLSGLEASRSEGDGVFSGLDGVLSAPDQTLSDPEKAMSPTEQGFSGSEKEISAWKRWTAPRTGFGPGRTKDCPRRRRFSQVWSGLFRRRKGLLPARQGFVRAAEKPADRVKARFQAAVARVAPGIRLFRQQNNPIHHAKSTGHLEWARHPGQSIALGNAGPGLGRPRS